MLSTLLEASWRHEPKNGVSLPRSFTIWLDRGFKILESQKYTTIILPRLWEINWINCTKWKPMRKAFKRYQPCLKPILELSEIASQFSLSTCLSLSPSTSFTPLVRLCQSLLLEKKNPSDLFPFFLLFLCHSHPIFPFLSYFFPLLPILKLTSLHLIFFFFLWNPQIDLSYYNCYPENLWEIIETFWNLLNQSTMMIHAFNAKEIMHANNVEFYRNIVVQFHGLIFFP